VRPESPWKLILVTDDTVACDGHNRTNDDRIRVAIQGEGMRRRLWHSENRESGDVSRKIMHQSLTHGLINYRC
ncbi:MAG: hypothetical protein ABL921_10665, partial [Pirellula sp.]